MNLSDWVGLGNKIQIRLVYQLEQLLKGAEIEVKVYASRVYNILSDNVLEITMPTDILYQKGINKYIFGCKKTISERYNVSFEDGT